METLWRDLGFDGPDGVEFARVAIKPLLAAALGGIMGWERERRGKAAGLRTHMLVAVGAALFVMAPLEAGVPLSDLTRVMQGVATGIGFVGAGAILKMSDQGQIVGLTTAAGIWMTAAIGMAVGAGRIWLPVLGYYRLSGTRDGEDAQSGAGASRLAQRPGADQSHHEREHDRRPEGQDGGRARDLLSRRFRVGLNREFVDRVRIDGIVPDPIRSEALPGDQILYVFLGGPGGAPVPATFHFTPRSAGVVRARVAAPGIPHLSAWILVYP